MKINYERFFYLSKNVNSVIDSEGKHLAVNDTFCEKSGHNRDQMIGTSIFNVVHPNEVERTKNSIAYLKSGNKSFSIETTMKDHLGRTHHLLVNASIDPQTGFIYFSSADITDVKNVTLLLEKVAEESNETLTETVEKLLDSHKKLEEKIKENLKTQQILKKQAIYTKKALKIENELNELKS